MHAFADLHGLLTRPRRNNLQERNTFSRMSHHPLPKTAEPFGPDYGCVEWYIYEEPRVRRDGIES